MERLVEDIARGNVAEVKVVLASVALALAVYQLALAAVAYERLRPRFLASAVASWAHRASGDVILLLVAAVATACVSYYGFEDGGAHAIAACVLLAVLAAKVVAVRVGGRLGRLLPLLGLSLFAALAVTWLTSAGDFLGVR
ncbi:MAG TPA: DUF6529 family protein [Solirubrobacterales bacterium]|nr:DUF6529 family protein [Solirubrobacterales bacterium]